MLEYFIYTFGIMCVLAIVYSTLRLIQLNKFFKAMCKALGEVSYSRFSVLNIEESYDNLAKSWPWDYNFDRMIVR